jgi:S-DNA-T family DNA segregation ATPase FtsK/SpoIIIE
LGKYGETKMARRQTGFREEIGAQIKGILIIAIAVFCYAGVTHAEQAGELGIFVHNLFRIIAGDTAVVIPFLIAILGLRTMLPEQTYNLKSRLIGILILLLLFTIWAHFKLMLEQADAFTGQDFYRASLQMGLQKTGGGLLGAIFAVFLFFCFKEIGSYIVLAAAGLIAVLLITNVTVTQIFGGLGKFLALLGRQLGRLGLYLKEIYAILMSGTEEEPLPREKKIVAAGEEDKRADEVQLVVSLAGENSGATVKTADAAAPAEKSHYQKERRLALVEPNDRDDPEPERKKETRRPSLYLKPSLDLLARPTRPGEQQQVKGIRERARLLEDTLHSFGVKARVIHVQSGPTVTRFEVQPEAGVKVSRIVSLSDDIALNLAAPLVRIEAPIPGKAALGIEVPNKIISLVYLREVLEDPAFLENPSPLTIGLGKDITGVPVISDLTRMPHLLIAGATGSGKSVCLNALIISILLKARPEQVRFLMIDPKVVELSVYNNIAHLLMPVVTEPKKASLALRNMVQEMGRRYEIFAREEVRDVATYNELAAGGHCEGEPLPYYVVIIDELADLMLVSPGEVEDSIGRLAQMSRAAGIHLVIATQRPSVDVLTGVIKANITSRIAFTVSSQVDSRTILDMAGAEKLLGRGDMLFYPIGSVKPTRIQGAYISEREIKRITDYIKEQGKPSYEIDPRDLEVEADEEFEPDVLFPDAVELVVRMGEASISLLQRRFRIGYTRAARLIDDLERRGVVGEHEGSKPREVVIAADEAAVLCEEFKQKTSS